MSTFQCLAELLSLFAFFGRVMSAKEVRPICLGPGRLSAQRLEMVMMRDYLRAQARNVHGHERFQVVPLRVRAIVESVYHAQTRERCGKRVKRIK